MGLRDEINDHKKRAGTVCLVQQVITKFPKAEVQELKDVLADETVTAASLARALGARGFKIAQGSISRHRRKECSCGTV